MSEEAKPERELPPLCLTVEETARCVRHTPLEIIEAMKAGDLGHIRRGKCPAEWVIRYDCLQDFLDSQTVKGANRHSPMEEEKAA